jgi:hypothetical protein
VEWDVPISPIGRLCLPGHQLKFSPILAGRVATVWADQRSIHVSVDGQLIRTRPSRFTSDQLRHLLATGRPAGSEPAPSAAGTHLPDTIEVDRAVSRDGDIALGGHRLLLAAHLAGQQVTLRFDGPMLHVIADGNLVKTLNSPIPAQQRRHLVGARTATSPLPPPPAPPLKALRKVGSNGTFMIANQKLRIGRSHAGKTVTIIIDDNVFRILDGDVELAAHARLKIKPQQRFRGVSRGAR